MTEPAATSGPAWTVTGQQEQTVINAQGNAVAVVTVSFALPDGTAGTVQVPVAAYNAANVRAAIAAKAATLAEVANLSG